MTNRNSSNVGYRKAFILLGQFLLGISLTLVIGLRLFQPAQAIATQTVASSSNVSGTSVLNLSNIAQALQQGRDLYQAGRFQEAAAIWQQAVKTYEQQGDPLNQAIALSYLSLAYQQLGQLAQAEEASSTSLTLVKTLKPASPDVTSVLAHALNTQGSLQLAQGKVEQALETWKKSAASYAQTGDEVGRVGSLVNQAQAQQSLGRYLQARKTLEEVQQLLEQQADLQVQVAGLRSLGDVLRAVGDGDKSQLVLEKSLALAQKNSLPGKSEILLSLGNTARAKRDRPTALSYYQQAAASPALNTRVQANLNQLSLLLEEKQWSNAEALQSEIRPQIDRLALSRTAIYTQINFTQSLVRLKQGVPSARLEWTDIAKLAATAVQNARKLQDQRAEAYAIGNLGSLYEKTEQWSDATNLTRKALELSQALNASDIAYQWQWQLGRLLKRQAEKDGLTGPVYTEALAAYTEAVKTLRGIRNDMATVSSRDVQFSFQESVEPVYRQLVGLLLKPSDSPVSQANLQQAREVIESLQLAQLENYLKEACFESKPKQIDKIDPQAAIVYSIILEDRLEVILALPNQPLQHYASAIAQTDLEKLLSSMRRGLRRTSILAERLSVAQKVYDVFLRPADPYLAKSQVKTLVFVLDGPLQALPMAMLHDGQQYLIEKYTIALAPGLQLVESEPFEREKLRVLVGGLSEARRGFSALPGVESEVKQITSEVTTQVLLNQKFTSESFQQQIETSAFPIVHLATHGQFSSNADDTFILAWDTPIKVKQLDDLLRARELVNRRPIELLILSACQTAVGDRRATLGIAGVAVKSGARSTLATLWSVDDRSTTFLMTQFYQNLIQGKMTRSEALRQAQLSLKEKPGFTHPFYWAPYVLVGNWL